MAAVETPEGVPLGRAFTSDVFPLDRLDPGGDLLEFLNKIVVVDYEQEAFDPGPGERFDLELAFAEELAVDLIGLEGFSLVLGGPGATLAVGASFEPDRIEVTIGAGARLRFSQTLLKPVHRVGDRWEPDPARTHAELELNVAIVIDDDWNVSFDGAEAFELQPAMVADSGLVLEGEVALDLSETTGLPESLALGLGPSWRGAVLTEVVVHLPNAIRDATGAENLAFEGFHIGSGGVSGTVSLNAPGAAAEVGGFPFVATSLSVELRQNCLVGAELVGELTVPFFDESLDVTVGFDLDGNFTVGVGSPNGIAALEKPDILSVSVDGITFGSEDGVWSVGVSGRLTPLLGGVDWPTFEVQELSIDSEGNVDLEGGWLDLPSQYSLDFHGFTFAITKLGFGKTDDGDRWVGFSGGIKLVEGLPAGASVEGLRVLWDDAGDTRVTLEGVGVELEIPNVLRFKGAVSYREQETDQGTVHRFDGEITLELTAIGLRVDGKLVVGRAVDADFTFFAIYVGVELPAGIPLWATGLALYGVAGLVAISMAPNKAADEEWYENLDGSPGWYLRPEVGVTELATKWDPLAGAFALGGGVTIATLVDNGFTFSAKVLLVISLPGPVILIEGKANLLKERSKLTDDPLFRMLAVLDFRSGTFLVGVGAEYAFGDKRQLIDIGGSAEAYFSFADPMAWHLYLGRKDPKEKRIRAELFKIFEANAYFMLDGKALQTGAWIGWDKNWRFGPVRITFEAWIEGGAMLNWKPAYFQGEAWLHGKVEIALFGIGFGLSADARLGAGVFDPFHLLAQVRLGILLPWPLPDFEVEVTLEWGPTPERPPLPLPLKEIAVEHFKSTASWALPRGGLLLPDHDAGNGFVARPVAAADEDAPAPADAPVVPLDGRPHLTFGRAVHDDALVGTTPQPPHPSAEPPGWERIGDPAENEGPMRVRFGLREVSIERWADGSWSSTPVARKAVDANPEGVPELYGSWAPIPSLPSGEVAAGTDPPIAQVKLWLWSKTPFDHSNHGGRAWDEWFTDRFVRYPCLPPAPDQVLCCDFDHLQPGELSSLTSTCVEHPEIVFASTGPVTVESVFGGRALCWHDADATEVVLIVSFGSPAKGAVVHLIGAGTMSALGVDTDDVVHGPFAASGTSITVDVPDLQTLILRGSGCVTRICGRYGPDRAAVDQVEEMAQHIVDATGVWSDVGAVLEPDTTYRVRVVTTVEAVGEGELSGEPEVEEEITELAYFRTEGPPGLTTLSTPVNHPGGEEFASGLETLERYVRQTVPPTVPPAGELPTLPRPVYRAYDVGALFNEDYVDLMYRLAHRDLAVHLYDANNRPVRDPDGRLVVLANRWGELETTTFTETELRFLRLLDGVDCAAVELEGVPHDTTLFGGGPGHVLRADTVYEARLTPLLLHEDFSDGLGSWIAVDSGASEGPSAWAAGGHPTITGGAAGAAGDVVTLDGDPDLSRVEPGVDVVVLARDTARPSREYRVLAVDDAAKTLEVDGVPSLSGGSSPWKLPPWGAALQGSNVWGGTTDGRDPVKPGTILAGGSPSWTDYRFSVNVRSTDDDAIGVVFRYQGPGDHYRYSMDRQRRYRRLVRLAAGVHTVLAEDDGAYVRDQDYLVTVEVLGETIRVYEDGAVVFAVTDTALPQGQIGLYCWANTGARFGDVRVDELAAGAPVAHRFSFTTSRYATVFHHLHSFQDEVWPASPVDSDLAAALAAAVPPGVAPGDDEARALEELAGRVLGPAAQQEATGVEVVRVETGGHAVALLVRGPEPIQWDRTELAVRRAAELSAAPDVPTDVKLTDVTSAPAAVDEHVTLLLREELDLSGTFVEQRALPGPLASPPAGVLLEDDFGGLGGVLLREDFGPNALDRYTIVDEDGTRSGPSAWAVDGDAIVQTSNIVGDGRAMPGTMAVTGPAMADVRIRVRLRSGDDDGIGIVFRYRDDGNFYRLSLDRQQHFRRLVRRHAGGLTVLWQDEWTYETGVAYEVGIDACGDAIVVRLDGDVLAAVNDDDPLDAGQVGFYSYANTGARFESLTVEALEGNPILWRPALTSIDELDVADEGDEQGPSEWHASGGTLTQSSNILGGSDDPAEPGKPGTVALGGEPGWEDYQLSVRLRSGDDDAIGIVVRRLDADNWYRFSLDREGGYRRLAKRVAGVVSVLWEDNGSYAVGEPFDLSVAVEGDRIRGWVDGSLLFDVADGDVSHGRVGFYTWANTDARFSQVLVTDLSRRVDRWAINDDGTIGGPSLWRLSGGALVQRSPIRSPAGGRGTVAVAGEPTWGDCRVAATLRSDDNGAIGLVFRYRDHRNHYRLSLGTSHRRLVRILDGAATTLWADDGQYEVGQAFTLAVDLLGSRLVGHHGSTRIFDLTDDVHPLGKVGLYCSNNDGARFEQVVVSAPPLDAHALFADRFAHGDLNAWTVVDEGAEEAPSAWIVVDRELRQASNIHSLPVAASALAKRGTHLVAGDAAWSDVVFVTRLRSFDDDAIGVLFRYAGAGDYYRFSMDRERGYRRLVRNVDGVFSVLWEDEAGFELGRSYELAVVAVGPVLRAFLDGVPMFVVEDDALAAGRIGLYCWADDDARFARVQVFPAAVGFNRWLLDEQFLAFDPGRWTVVDDGDQQGPSDWHVSDGELRQSTNILGGSSAGADPEKPGTHVIAGDPAWRDYRLTVVLQSDDDDAIGAFVRYADDDNYYRLSLDRQGGYRRLVKRVNGVVTVLWEDGVRYEVGRRYVLTLDAVGDVLTGHLNGTQLFRVRDPDLAAGRIGLYCWANTGARFAEVRVAEADWIPYYRFGAVEPRLSAGSRVRVHSGNERDAGPAEPNLERRFIATLDDPGTVHFDPSGPVDLRVRRRGQDRGHRRCFLSGDAYTAVDDVRVLRKADGTAFAIVLDHPSPPGSRIPPGEYRLSLTYRRDNRAARPDSLVLRQAGDQSPETVNIDVPWTTLSDD